MDRAGADANRKESLKGTPRRCGYDRDEWPPAFLNTGGSGASVRYMKPKPNRGLGEFLGNSCKGLPDGTNVNFQFPKRKK